MKRMLQYCRAHWSYILLLAVLAGLLFFTVLDGLAASQTGMIFKGEINSWTATSMTLRNLGTPNWRLTQQAGSADSESNFLFCVNNSCSSNQKWARGDAVSINSLTTWYVNPGGDGRFNQANGKYYTFTWKDVVDGANSEGYVLETSGNPVTISSVTQSPAAAQVSDNDNVSVTVTLSGAKSSEEKVYIRYTTNNWSSTSAVEITSFNASHQGSASIPAQAAGTTVQYYVLTTTVDSASWGSNVDLVTIEYNNNGGSNYSYTPKYGTTQAGDWNQTSTWKSGVVPNDSTKDVIIAHNVTLNQDASVKSLLIRENTFTGSDATPRTLTIANSGAFSNNSTFTHGSGTVAFSGTATVSGTVGFYNVTLVATGSDTGLDFGSSATINGTLEINSHRNVGANAPTYAVGSTLKYAVSYNVFNEWKAGSSGTGVPYHVQIASGATLNLANAGGTARTARGNLTIDGGLTLGNDAGEDLNVGGNFTLNSGGTFTHSSRSVSLNGATTQNLTLNTSATFSNLTVASGTTLVETVAANNATVSGTLTNNGVIRKTLSGTGAQTFGLTGVTLNVGAGLTSIQVERRAGNHPNATARQSTGEYWALQPTGSGTVNMTLPHSGLVHPAVCTWSAGAWTCGSTTATVSTIRLDGVNLAANLDVALGGLVIDGETADWTGVASATAHSDAANNAEWIYTGAGGDRRTVAGMSADGDLTEVRVATGGSSLYLLIRLQDITDINKVSVALTIDSNQHSDDGAKNWVGPDSGLTTGRQFMRWERLIVLHGVGGAAAIELHRDTDADGTWFTPSGGQISISTVNDVIEARVPLADLGLTTTSDFIVTAATFIGTGNANSTGNATADFIEGSVGNDAVDVMGVPGQTGSALDRDLNDNNVYFGWWLQLQDWGNAPTAVVWDRLYHSSCDQIKASSCAAGDHPVEQFVPGSAGETARFLSAHRWSTDGTVAPGGVSDVFVYDDESVDVYLLSHKDDLTRDGSSEPRLRYYDTATGTQVYTYLGDIDDWTGGWKGTPSVTYDVFKGLIPTRRPGSVYYYFTGKDQSGDRAVCRRDNAGLGFANQSENRGGLNQWVREAACASNTDYVYTVIDDDITGPTITGVTASITIDGLANDQVGATVYDTHTRSGDADSGLAAVTLRYAATLAAVQGGGGSTAALTQGSGNTWSVSGLNLSDPTYYRVEATNNDSDWGSGDRESSASSIYCAGVGCSSSGASLNNDIWWNEVRHDTRSTTYRSPFGAVATGATIDITLRVADGDLTAAHLMLYNSATGNHDYTMTEINLPDTDPVYDWYRYTIPDADTANARVMSYKFKLVDGTDEDWYIDDHAHNEYDHEDRYENGSGLMVDDGSTSQYYDNSFRITVYTGSAYSSHLDSWAKDAVIYQILPDRFRSGTSSNDTNWPSGYTVYGIDPLLHPNWNEPVGDTRDSGSAYYQKWSADFFGGDLQGVIDELDYLESIGVTAIYFNPIFASPSNHGYDTTDYLQINSRYGTNALFQTLNSEAEARGIKIILDGVFNHTGSDSRYFDRYSRWNASGSAVSGNDGSGACEASGSPYSGFFTLFGSGGPCYDGKSYDSWWGYDSLPLLIDYVADNDVRDYVFNVTPSGGAFSQGVIQFWYGLGADGWRFDVADEIPHSFWQQFRTQVKNNDNKNGPLYSEVWYEATPWLLGDQLDATMNYRYRKAVLGFLINSTWTDNDNNGDQTMWKLSPSEFDYALNSIREDYPRPSFEAMMNLMDSHDTNRALFVLREKSTDLPEAIKKMKMMAALQFTYPGAPTIYYGDEVGVGARDYAGYGTWGAGKAVSGVYQDDPYNRQSYPWADQSGSLPGGLPNTSLRDTYRTLALTRNSYDVLRSGEVTTLLADDDANVYAYARTDSTSTQSPDCAIAIFNRSAASKNVTVDVSGLAACQNEAFEDVLNAGADWSSNATSLTVNNIPALSGAVLVQRFDNPNTTDTVASLAPVQVTTAGGADSINTSATTSINATIRDVAGQTLPAGVTVKFTLLSGSGSLSNGVDSGATVNATTNGSGVASVTYTAPASRTLAVVRAEIKAPSGVTYSASVSVFAGYSASVTSGSSRTVETGIGPQIIDAETNSSIAVRKTGNGEPVISVAKFSGLPVASANGNVTSQSTPYVDLHIDSTSGITELEIKVFCTASCNASDILWWWDAAGSRWRNFDVANTGQTANYVWGRVNGSSTSPTLADLNGTPLMGGNPSPTLIELGRFEATRQADGVLLAWETLSEIDTVGFNLWRSEAENGAYVQINPSLIPARGGPTTSAVYVYLDATAQPGVAYYYQLEDVDQHGGHGVGHLHGPVLAQHRHYLPAIVR